MHAHYLINRTTSRLDGSDLAVIAQIGGNSKTNRVVTLWTMPADMVGQTFKPAEYIRAMKDGAIDSVCPKACEHRADGKAKCYIQHNVRAASSATAAIKHGVIEMPFPKVLEIASLLGITKVRSMGAGDACALPSDAWMLIELAVFCHRANGHDMDFIGYTAGWRNTPWLINTHMASVTNKADALEAERQGWRAFYSMAPQDDPQMPEGFKLCPASKEFENKNGKRLSCSECGLCNGAQSDRDSIAIPRHGNGDRSAWSARGRRGQTLRNASGRTVGHFVDMGSLTLTA